MRLFLARHGETGTHYRGRYIGSTDLPLSEKGREQARRLSDVLPPGGIRCFCSPMRRTLETATLALDERKCIPEVVDSLREVDFGRWEGLSFAEILARDQGLVDEWQRNPLSFSFPQGEQTGAFRNRVEEWLKTIITLPEDVLAFSHGGVIRVILCSLLGVSFAHYLSFSIAPAALTVIEVDGQRGVLQALNLTSLAAAPRGAR